MSLRNCLYEEKQLVLKAYRGDNAVDGFPDGLALFSAIPVNTRGLQIGFDALRLIDREFQEVLFSV